VLERPGCSRVKTGPISKPKYGRDETVCAPIDEKATNTNPMSLFIQPCVI